MGKAARRRRARRDQETRGRAAAASPRSPAARAAVAGGALVAIFVGALVVRLLHVWQIEASPFGDLLLGDSAGYDRWARRIAAGDWLGSEVFYQAPLYPYVLGLIYTGLGHDVTIVRICQAVAGAGSCVLLAAAGGRFFSPRVGVGAGVALAVYAPAIFMDATVQKSGLDLFLMTSLLWLVSRTLDQPPRAGAWLGIGVVIGAFSLTRENALVLAAAVVVWGWMERPRLHRPALVAAGLLLVLVPVAARNGVVGGEWHLTTSQFGPNFYIGNHAGADGTYQPLRFGRGDPEFERDDATALAEAAVGRDLTPAGVSRYWVDRTFTDISDAPGRWLRQLGRKAALTFNAVEIVDTESQYAHAEHSVPLMATGWAMHVGLLVPLAVIGIAATWRARRRLTPLYLMLGMYAASVVAFYVFARYRYPLAPLLVVFAVAGGDHLVRVVRRQTTLVRVPVVAAALVAAVAANWPMLSTSEMRAVSYNNLATAYRERGDLETAVGWYETALALTPEYAEAHSNLASALTAAGSPEGAVEHYQRAIALEPATGDVHFNYGNALLAQGRYEEAAERFQVALDIWPDDAEAHNNLGMALGSIGRMEEAAASFRHAVRIDPEGALAHRNLAAALDELGDPAAAARHRREAERLDGIAPRPR